MMEDESMYETLMELMEPQIQIREQKSWDEGQKQGWEQGQKQGWEQGQKQGWKQGIQGTVEVLREFGHKDSEIKAALIKKYGLTEETAEKYL